MKKPKYQNTKATQDQRETIATASMGNALMRSILQRRQEAQAAVKKEPTMTKLCVECKWAHCIDPALAPEHQYWQCGHPTATIPAQVHLVTGAVKPSVQASCDMVRNLDRNLRGEVWCGPGGVFWEPIPIGKISGLGFGEREN